MSFLVDPPLLVGTGAAIERAVSDQRTARRVEAGVLAVFLVTSVSLYLNLGWTSWLWRLCGAESGRDWMLNSGVFHFDHKSSAAGTHVISAALFASYPLWLQLGRRVGRMLTPTQGVHPTLATLASRAGKILLTQTS